ncbi:hypothetical protein A1507_10960 [Methylomonas koyamae]|uniref:Uncharacterized protein n=1 Tax=Methylomonas koyamae TaxID=702114 RepID=A0A177NHU4_9GAMM|nr:hypothetical protein A1507_10960 [Methylomonas koyamae]
MLFKSVSKFQIQSLQPCVEQIARQQQLLRVIKNVLPPQIASHATHCVVSGRRLSVYTDSASWASQIRFFSNDILDELRERGELSLVRLQVRVLMSDYRQTKVGRKPRLPSRETIDLLCLKSEACRADDPLAKALMRLGATLKRRAEADQSG